VRRTIPTKLAMVIEEVRPIIASLTFLDPIRSFAANGHWKFVKKCCAWRALLCVTQSHKIMRYRPTSRPQCFTTGSGVLAVPRIADCLVFTF